MFPTPGGGPGAEMAEAFLAAMMSASATSCECEACRILRVASTSWRARLAGTSAGRP